MINWQPIDTAPKDGTDILVYDGYDVWKVCYMGSGVFGGEWFRSGTCTTVFHQPTMWLPISDLLKPLGHL